MLPQWRCAVDDKSVAVFRCAGFRELSIGYADTHQTSGYTDSVAYGNAISHMDAVSDHHSLAHDNAVAHINAVAYQYAVCISSIPDDYADSNHHSHTDTGTGAYGSLRKVMRYGFGLSVRAWLQHDFCDPARVQKQAVSGSARVSVR